MTILTQYLANPKLVFQCIIEEQNNTNYRCCFCCEAQVSRFQTRNSSLAVHAQQGGQLESTIKLLLNLRTQATPLSTVFVVKLVRYQTRNSSLVQYQYMWTTGVNNQTNIELNNLISTTLYNLSHRVKLFENRLGQGQLTSTFSLVVEANPSWRSSIRKRCNPIEDDLSSRSLRKSLHESFVEKACLLDLLVGTKKSIA